MKTITPCRWLPGPKNCVASPVDTIKGHIVPLLHLSNDISFVLLEREHKYFSGIGNQRHQGYPKSIHKFPEQQYQQC